MAKEYFMIELPEKFTDIKAEDILLFVLTHHHITPIDDEWEEVKVREIPRPDEVNLFDRIDSLVKNLSSVEKYLLSELRKHG